MSRSLYSWHGEPRTDLIFFPPRVFGTGRKGKSWTISTTGTLDTPGSQQWSTWMDRTAPCCWLPQVNNTFSHIWGQGWDAFTEFKSMWAVLDLLLSPLWIWPKLILPLPCGLPAWSQLRRHLQDQTWKLFLAVLKSLNCWRRCCKGFQMTNKSNTCWNISNHGSICYIILSLYLSLQVHGNLLLYNSSGNVILVG